MYYIVSLIACIMRKECNDIIKIITKDPMVKIIKDDLPENTVNFFPPYNGFLGLS